MIEYLLKDLQDLNSKIGLKEMELKERRRWKYMNISLYMRYVQAQLMISTHIQRLSCLHMRETTKSCMSEKEETIVINGHKEQQKNIPSYSDECTAILASIESIQQDVINSMNTISYDHPRKIRLNQEMDMLLFNQFKAVRDKKTRVELTDDIKEAIKTLDALEKEKLSLEIEYSRKERYHEDMCVIRLKRLIDDYIKPKQVLFC